MQVATDATSRSSAQFAATHWSIVLTARDGSSSRAAEALETLCHIYWRPLYAFIRREGYSAEDAQDLTQDFFRRFLEKKWLGHLQHRLRRRHREILREEVAHTVIRPEEIADEVRHLIGVVGQTTGQEGP